MIDLTVDDRCPEYLLDWKNLQISGFFFGQDCHIFILVHLLLIFKATTPGFRMSLERVLVHPSSSLHPGIDIIDEWVPPLLILKYKVIKRELCISFQKKEERIMHFVYQEIK